MGDGEGRCRGRKGTLRGAGGAGVRCDRDQWVQEEVRVQVGGSGQ